MEYSSSELIELLIVDEDSPVVETIQSCFPASRYHCVTTTRGTVAFQLLEESQFHVVLCGMHLPGMDGVQVLRRGLSKTPQPLFVMLSSPSDWELAMVAMKMGACECLRKPFQCEEVVNSVERALESQRSKIESEIFRVLLAETLHERTQHLHNALQQVGEIQQSTLEMLVAALDAREHQTNLHSLRVQRFSLLLAEKCGYSGAQMKQLSCGALLHDIGKIAIPDLILLKPGKLTLDEFRIMQQHSMFGYQILSRIPHLRQAAMMALYHHERFDGMGYPMKLKGEDIPLAARIFAVADTLDVITAGRPYCPARTMEEARAEIQRCAGSQFDRDVVDVFLTIPDAEWLSAKQEVAARFQNVLPLFSPKTDIQPVYF